MIFGGDNDANSFIDAEHQWFYEILEPMWMKQINAMELQASRLASSSFGRLVESSRQFDESS